MEWIQIIIGLLLVIGIGIVVIRLNNISQTLDQLIKVSFDTSEHTENLKEGVYSLSRTVSDHLPQINHAVSNVGDQVSGQVRSSSEEVMVRTENSLRQNAYSLSQTLQELIDRT